MSLYALRSARHGRRAFLGTLGALGAGAWLAACDKRATPAPPLAETKKAPLIAPAALAARLDDVKAGKLAVLHIGPRVLWQRSRVPGSRWVGETGTDAGLRAFEAAVKELPADVEIVAYCGCCAVADCPNVRPARRALGERARASVLDLPTNFRTDWIDPGHPIEKG